MSKITDIQNILAIISMQQVDNFDSPLVQVKPIYDNKFFNEKITSMEIFLFIMKHIFSNPYDLLFDAYWQYIFYYRNNV